jgi:hypothetical protein
VFARRLALVACLVVVLSGAAATAPAAAGAGATASPAVVDPAANGDTAATAVDARTATPATLADGPTVDRFSPGGDAPDRGAGATPSVDAAAGSSAAQIGIDRRLARLPDRPGEVRATLTPSIPDGVTRLTLYLPGEVTAVTGGEGFERVEAGRYEWTGAPDPSLSVRVAVNRSASGARIGDGSGYAFVDTGAWALMSVPSVGVGWSERSGTAASVVRTTSVDGQGATGGEIAYLGPVERYERSAAGGSFTLAVPERASLAADPATVLDSLAAAADGLRIGDRDSEVFVVAAPQGEVEMGVRGLQAGPDDAWVGADEPVDSADNVWVHEYVHTRQDFETTESGRWLAEASADYFAALSTLEQGRIDYTDFRDQLARGTRTPYRDAVLSDPRTWEGQGSNYRKGALVLGAIDRRLRLATDGEHNLATVFTALNRVDDPVSTATFVESVARESADLRSDAARYATTEATPGTWTAGEHAAAFDGSPAAIELTALRTRLTGPSRNRTVAIAEGDPPRLVERPVVGERVVVAATLENAGGRTGTYDLPLAVDGTVVDRRTGDLAPGERTTARFVVDVSEESRRLRIGGRELVVDGVPPATAAVAGLAVEPDEIDVDDRTTVTATLVAPDDRPARRSLTVRVGGSVVEERTVWLDAGERRAMSVTVAATTAGRFDVTVGETTRELVVGGVGTTTAASGDDGSGSGSGPAPVSGPGPAVAVLAVLAALLGGARATRD